jgi:hypothetical protein
MDNQILQLRPADQADEDALLSSLRLSQDFASVVGVEKVLLTVPVRKPNKDEFFRVHPDHKFDCLLIELKTEGELYFVVPGVAQVLAEFVAPARLFLCVNRQQTVFVWPAKLPRDDRRTNTWHQSALEAAELAKKSWIRIAADRSLGAYQPFRAQADLGDAAWPDKPFLEVLKIALKGRVVDHDEHPLVKQLLGAA